MKSVSKGKLKAEMLAYFREVEATGEPLIVTDRGVSVLEVRRYHAGASVAEVLAEYRKGSGRGLVGGKCGDEVIEPLPAGDWEVLREDDGNPW